MSTPRVASHIECGLSSQRCPATGATSSNRVRNFERFHLSYNPRCSDYGCDTTALVLQGRVFFVLNGDHVAPMVESAEQMGVQGCVDYFIDRIHEANPLSEHRMAVGITADLLALGPTTIDTIGQHNVGRIFAAQSKQD